MFQFSWCPPQSLCVQQWVTEYCSAGFLHSEISGSTLLCNSPEPIAAVTSFFGNLSLGIRRTPCVASTILVFILMRSSSLGAFNAQSTYLYTVVKMLSPLWARFRHVCGLAERDDTTPCHGKQGPKEIFGRSGLLAHQATVLGRLLSPVSFSGSGLGRVRVCENPVPIFAKTSTRERDFGMDNTHLDLSPHDPA